MPYFSSLQQFIDSVTARLTKPKRGVGGSEGVVAADVLEALKDTGKYADDVRVSSAALNAGFVARSLSSYALIYVQGDIGNDSRTGETFGNTNANGPVKTLERVAQLHSNKTQSLFVEIRTGTVEVTADVLMNVPDLTIYVWPGATLRFRKRTALKDASNVTVGDGTWGLRCRSMVLNVRNDGLIDVEAHTGSTGVGDQFYYRRFQGAFSITGESFMSATHQYQSVLLTMFSNVTVGANTTLFAAGSQGIEQAYASDLARYRRFNYSNSTVVLGAGASESALNTDKLRETLVFEGNGAAKTFNLRRSYAFAFEIVYNDGCTISVQPAGNCSANANNTLTFTGAVGKTVTVRLTSNINL